MVDHSCREGSTGTVNNRHIEIICLICGEGDDKSSPVKKLKNQNSHRLYIFKYVKSILLVSDFIKDTGIYSKQNEKVANALKFNWDETDYFYKIPVVLVEVLNVYRIFYPRVSGLVILCNAFNLTFLIIWVL